MSLEVVPQNANKLKRYRDSIGLDIFAELFNDVSLRPQVIDGHIYLSMVSLMELLGNSKKGMAPKRIWDNLKRSLKKSDPQLTLNLRQLKMISSDGKRYLTDAAELKIALKIIHRMRTPNARAFSDLIDDRIAGIVEAALNYRLFNIAHGYEWAADTIQVETQDLEIPSQSSAWEEMGYNGENRDG